MATTMEHTGQQAAPGTAARSGGVSDRTRSVRWDIEGTWERDFIHCPAPAAPLMASFVLATIASGTEKGFAEWSFPIARLRYAAVNGWVYQRIEPFGGDLPAPMKKFPVLANLWRVNPKLRGRILGFDRFVRAGGFEQQVPRWEREWRPAAERRLAALTAIDLKGVSDRGLADHLDAWYAYLDWAWSVHFPIHFVCFYIRERFAEICRRHGLSDFETYALVQRSEASLFEATNRLAAMARRASADPVVSQALAQPAEQVLASLRGTWFETALNEFLDAHGDMPVGGFYLTDPTWREQPDVVVAQVKELMASGYDPAAEDAALRERRRARIDAVRTALHGAERATFDRWLGLVEQAYPLNETHNYLLFDQPMGLIRYAALEAGRRLAAAGSLITVDDVFYLTREELAGALRTARDVRAIAAARRAEHEYNGTLAAPPTLGGTPAPPPVQVFPPAVAAAMQAILRQAAAYFGVAPSPSPEGQVTGTPGGPGVGEGPARIVRGPEDFGKIKRGDVLVCPLTNAAWTVLFPLVAGLVTDSGGALSHPAIVAREYGVPSVVGTLVATQRIRDGQRVRVDGAAGTVHLLD